MLIATSGAVYATTRNTTHSATAFILHNTGLGYVRRQHLNALQ